MARRMVEGFGVVHDWLMVDATQVGYLEVLFKKKVMKKIHHAMLIVFTTQRL